MIGTAWAFAARPDGYLPAPGAWAPLSGVRGSPTCNPPTLPGQTVDVALSDMGGMMSGARVMNVAAGPSSIPAGDVSFGVWNAGMMVQRARGPSPPSGRGGHPSRWLRRRGQRGG